MLLVLCVYFVLFGLLLSFLFVGVLVVVFAIVVDSVVIMVL